MEPVHWLLIAAICFIVYLVYSKYHDRGKKLTKQEFQDIAVQQGSSPDDADRHWRDYNRRF